MARWFLAIATLFGLIFPPVYQALAGSPARLSLTGEQAEQLEALKAELRESIAGSAAELRLLRGEVRELWAVDDPDLGAILAKGAELEAVRAQIREARARFGVEALGLLTPEQRSAHAELMREGASTHRGCPYREGRAADPVGAPGPGRAERGNWL